MAEQSGHPTTVHDPEKTDNADTPSTSGEKAPVSHEGKQESPEKKKIQKKDLKTCMFEHAEIKRQMVECFDRFKKNKKDSSTMWNWTSVRFELALIWDALLGADGERFFSPIKDGDISVDVSYKVTLRERDGEFSIQSLSENRSTFDAGRIRVKVELVHFIKTDTRETVLDITKDTLCQLLNTSDIGRKFILPAMRTITAPKVTCSGTVRNRLDCIIQQYSPEELERGLKEMWKSKQDENTRMLKLQESPASNFRDVTELRSHLYRVIKMANDALEDINENQESYKNLENAFRKCATVHFVYCDVVDVSDVSDVSVSWEKFLDAVCKVYDTLLAWKELHFYPHRHKKQHKKQHEESNGKKHNCLICSSSNQESFTDTRIPTKPMEYEIPEFPKSKRFCEVKNVIYLITCSGKGGSCGKRYVGQTKNSLSDRYSSGSKDDCKHFSETGHKEIFRILQIVDEGSLFPHKVSFGNYVKGNATSLEGVEKLWIDRLIDKKIGLNTKLNFQYGDEHRRHISELLRYFISKHKLTLVGKMPEYHEL